MMASSLIAVFYRIGTRQNGESNFEQFSITQKTIPHGFPCGIFALHLFCGGFARIIKFIGKHSPTDNHGIAIPSVLDCILITISKRKIVSITVRLLRKREAIFHIPTIRNDLPIRTIVIFQIIITV